MPKIYILHSFNARPYFEAVEHMAKTKNIQVEYRETNIVRSMVKWILRRKCVNCDLLSILKNIAFLLKVPFMKNQTIIYGTAPYDYRFVWYSLLKYKNNFIYHTSHHKWEDDTEAVFYYKNINAFFKKIWLKRLSDVKVVCVTQSVQKSVKNFLVNSSKIYQVYHSIDYDRFYKKRDFTNVDKLKILFVGRFVYEKGLDVIIDVINNVDKDKFEFTFVGDGKYKSKIEKVFQRKNVKYLGWISSKEEIAKTFKDHHILLNPSIKYKGWEELFGIVNIEAMASGMIVIASNHVGPREIISDKENGFLVEEKRSDLIIDILNKLYEDKKFMNYISNNALLKAKEFSIDVIAKQWERVING